VANVKVQSDGKDPVLSEGEERNTARLRGDASQAHNVAHLRVGTAWGTERSSVGAPGSLVKAHIGRYFTGSENSELMHIAENF